MKLFTVTLIVFAGAFQVKAQKTTLLNSSQKAVSEDSTQLHKIIPAEIPQPILDTLQKRNFTMADVSNAHRNGYGSVYVIEVSHDLKKEIFWFDPRGRKVRPSTEKGIN